MAKKAKANNAKATKTRPKKAKAKKVVKKAAAPRRQAVRGLPPYKCKRTLVAGVCLKFFYNSANGQYDLGGDRVDCATCEYFM
jgi:hypothetical protein